MNLPIIDIVVPSYKRYSQLQVIINCVLSQTYSNWRLHVVSDGKDEITEKIMDAYKDNPSIRYSFIPGPNGAWGHAAREYGLMNSSSDWILLTGDDNYYVPTFVEEFTKVIIDNPNVGFVWCNLIHDCAGYQTVDTQIEEYKIDMGCFITKTDIAKSIGFRERTYTADFKFADMYCKTSNCETRKISKFLYIHN
jgi:glycosyltransferase involved in cell wall biosynthesis